MNAKERKWIKEKIEKIFIEDSKVECDCQADDIMDFLSELAVYVGAKMS